MSTGDRNFGMGEDYLTGLPNIQAFYKRLEQERKRARDPLTEGELAVLYFNLVNFRLINLRYGLAAGDGYLARMAESLAASFPDGMVSHGNGDHFLILTDTLHLEERVANAREAIRKLFPISVECSIGAGIWDDPTLKPEEVCYRARLASEQNRKHLHTYFSCYSKELGERLEIADYAVSHIEEAITLGWIHVYYQPIVRALTNQICGMEALARWEDPKYGMLAPDKFISPLEEARLIWKLDLSVIRQVVSGIANRCQRGMLEIPVSINLSRLDFLCCDIFGEIESIVRFYDVPRQMLHIEVTESVLTSYEDSIIQALEAFRRVGYEIWMDDFGSGYSTLDLLKDCSFDVLKMDMQFLNSDTIRSRKIIASVIQMDKDIGNRTLAEGVETKEQVEFLKKAGCDKLQGYYFGKPAPFGEMLRNCIAAGIGIESAKQKICYDQLCGVNFRTDVPFAIVEARGDALHLLHLGDRALSLFRAEGISDQRALEEKINDRSNPVCRELRKTAGDAVRLDSRLVETAVPFAGKALILQARLIGTYDSTGLFEVKIYDRTPAGEELSSREQVLTDLLYFSRYLFCMDLSQMTIRSIRYTNRHALQGSAVPIRSENGRYASILPDIFEADQRRYDAFLCPKTLQWRLEQAQSGILTSPFRTRSSEGVYVWMFHRILLAPNADGKKIYYEICGMSEQEAELWSSWVRNQEAVPDEGANQTEDTRLHQEESRKAALFDNLLCHLPMGVFWKDSRRRFLGANPYFLDYYGFSSVADILGKTDEDMGWHPDNEKYRSNEEDVIASGIVVSSVPGRCIAKGVSRDIYATKWPTYEDGRISGLMGYFLDPGERGQAAGCVPEHPAKQDPMACSASRFLDDLLDFERDYQLNQRTFGVIYVRIPGLTRIADLYDRAKMARAARYCFDVIRSAVGNTGSVSCVGPDQFAAAASYLAFDELERTAQKICADIDAIREIDGLPCSLYAKVKVLSTAEAIKIRRCLLDTIYNTGDSREDSGTGKESETLLRTVLGQLPIGCYILRPDRTVQFWNHEAENILGYTAEEMIGKKCVEMPLGCAFLNGSRVPSSKCPAIVAFMRDSSTSMTMFMRNRQGRDVLISNNMVPRRDADGQVIELISFFTPLSKNAYDAELVRRLAKDTAMDSVTGLPGNSYLKPSLEEAMNLYRRTGQRFAVLLVSIAGSGDKTPPSDCLLREAGARLLRYGRRTDRFCRWNQNTFAGILQVKGPGDLRGAAERILDVLDGVEVTAEGRSETSRAFLGIALVREKDDIEDLLCRADRCRMQAENSKTDRFLTDLMEERAV